MHTESSKTAASGCTPPKTVQGRYRSSGHPIQAAVLPSLEKSDQKWHRFLWVKVLHFTDASGESCFKELAEFALSLLAMPLSNADVDRVFSHMNLVKPRLRNRMRNETMSTILHVRYGLRLRGVCCRDFQPTAKMMQLFNAKNMYGSAELDATNFPDLSDASDDDCV